MCEQATIGAASETSDVVGATPAAAQLGDNLLLATATAAGAATMDVSSSDDATSSLPAESSNVGAAASSATTMKAPRARGHTSDQFGGSVSTSSHHVTGGTRSKTHAQLEQRVAGQDAE